MFGGPVWLVLDNEKSRRGNTDYHRCLPRLHTLDKWDSTAESHYKDALMTRKFGLNRN